MATRTTSPPRIKLPASDWPTGTETITMHARLSVPERRRFMEIASSRGRNCKPCVLVRRALLMFIELEEAGMIEPENC